MQIENSRWKGKVDDAREESERIGKIGRSVKLEGWNDNVIMGASSQDRKIRIRVEKRKWRIEVEVIILHVYSIEVGEMIAADKEL